MKNFFLKILYVCMFVLHLYRFVSEYSNEQWRGYGANVVTVFEKLKETAFADIYQPAAEQFDGKGSYGNGGAMRIFPMALYAYSHPEEELVVWLH
jgi:poly(ADP-ribose) glycohydrolase ARH3